MFRLCLSAKHTIYMQCMDMDKMMFSSQSFLGWVELLQKMAPLTIKSLGEHDLGAWRIAMAIKTVRKFVL